MKQYGIDPRLVIWIQRNTGHDLQTFNDLTKMKRLDNHYKYSTLGQIVPRCYLEKQQRNLYNNLSEILTISYWKVQNCLYFI